MDATTIHLHTRLAVGAVDLRIYGGFLEHMGRAVYGGVFDPDSPNADDEGFRTDVLDALRPLAFTTMRYPGGNFASGYHWRDGVGPDRPAVRDLAWRSIEPNTFGTDEFLRLCRRMNWVPMLTVNLGSGTPEEACDWLEYCNAGTPTRWAELRAANGSPKPYAVKLWCLGNEMDGPWQIGHVPAERYAETARAAAAMMKTLDPDIELVACGSSAPGMATFAEWDRVVLEGLGDLADYVSLHRYVGNEADDTREYLATGASVDRQIADVDAVCRYVQARRGGRRALLCFDEWNVWYRERDGDGGWSEAPALLEETYNLEDALVVAQFVNCFLRRADVVKLANLAQVANVIAPVLTRPDDVLVQSIYHPLAMHAKRRGGVSLRVNVDGPDCETSEGRVPCVDATAVLDGDRLHVFCVNRSTDESCEVRVAPADRSVAGVVGGEIVTGDDPKACNTWQRRDAVVARPFDVVTASGGRALLELPALSFTAATLELD